MSSALSSSGGGRFDFDDGGTYCGGWLEGKAHGHGLCTGPKGQGTYAGTWRQGFEDVGVYEWPSGGGAYEGQWSEGKRHGLGAETRGCWIYRGEWTDGLKGRYGVRQSIASGAKYDGTWANGLQDGYGSETYADGGTFQGQWAKGMRHGYGVRSSAPFGLAAHRGPSTKKPSQHNEGAPGESPAAALERRPEDCRGGFVLKDYTAARDAGTWGRSLPDQNKGSPLKNATSRVPRASDDPFGSEDEAGHESDNATEDSFVVREDEGIDGNVIETYMGEWKNDKRSGFGIAERSDGIKYEGEWFNNKKFGYGLTTYKSGIEEYGKYKNNALLQSGGKKHLFILRSGKFKGRVQQAVSAAHRASQIALQKADIAISRTATARGKAEQADEAAKQARAEAEIARLVARQFAPEFQQPGPVTLLGYPKENSIILICIMDTFAFATLVFGLLGAVLCGEPEVPCPAPRSPEHGQAFLYQEGRVVKYVCEPGFRLLTMEIVRCVEGQWEEPNPTCVEIGTDGIKEEAEKSDVPVPPARPLFSWGSDNEQDNEQEVNSTEEEMPLSDEARIRLLMYPRRRVVTTVKTGKIWSATELEEEEKKRAQEDADENTSTTIQLGGHPSAVYVRRTVVPGKSEAARKALEERYGAAAVHMTVENGDDVQLISLPRAAVSLGDKGQQADEALRQLYWYAHHYNYPRHASLVNYRSGMPVVTTLTESQLAWINSLHPELRDQYLKDMYVVRAEESVEGERAQAFLQRYEDAYNYYYRLPYLRRPMSLVMEDPIATYDYTCHESGYPFIKAPRLRNMHVQRYDRRQNPNNPHNHYLSAVYRCNPGYTMMDTRFTELHCSKKNWIGVRPVCVRRG